MLERLLDGVNRQPTETRAKLPIVRLQSHEELRSGLHCLMVLNVMCMISMVDDNVDDTIWVICKLTQGIMKFVIIRTRLGVKCIKVVNLPLTLVNKNSQYSSYIGLGKGGEGSASYQLGSLKIPLSREVGSQASSLVQTMCGSCVQHLVPEAIVLFFVALVTAIEGVCDNHFIVAISFQKR
jgi:hypothetical protein